MALSNNNKFNKDNFFIKSAREADMMKNLIQKTKNLQKILMKEIFILKISKIS